MNQITTVPVCRHLSLIAVQFSFMGLTDSTVAQITFEEIFVDSKKKSVF